MPNKDNEHSHELTKISVQEEVERAIEGAVSGTKRQEVVARLTQIVHERSSGPLPDVSVIGGLEQYAPGCGREIIEDALRETAHRREVEKKELELQEKQIEFVGRLADSEFSSVRQGRNLGLCAYFACFAFSFLALHWGSEKVALVAIGTAAIGVIVQLIRGSSLIRFSAEKGGKPDAQKKPGPPDKKKP